MTGNNSGIPDYGNWVSFRIIYMPGVIGLAFLGLAILFPLLAILAIILFMICIYFAYARYLFSPNGADIQSLIRQLVLNNLDWNGKGSVLDVGCGNGALVVGLAKKYPETRVTGIDYWGKNWEYSKSGCEKNADIEGVKDRVTFQQASASSLPFANESFDAVVSNLTFHEVRDIDDKKEAVREALRVLKKGGSFCFQDLFLMKGVYGDIDELLGAIKGWGVNKVTFVETNDSPFIPSLLKLPFILGTMGIIVGEK